MVDNETPASVQKALQAATVPAWDKSKHQRMRARIAQARRRRTATAGAALATVLLCVLGSFAWYRGARGTETRLADGSAVQTLSAASVFHVDEESGTLTRTRLDSGRARFVIAKTAGTAQPRRFLVQTGLVNVEVLGTTFVVERRLGEVEVVVEEGHVKVTAPNGEMHLFAGQRTVMADASAPERTQAVAPNPAPAAVRTPAVPSPAAVPTPAVVPSPAVAPSPSSSAAPVKDRAKTRAADAAKAAVEPEPASPSQDLLAQADVERGIGNYRQAAELLEAFLRAQPTDVRASAAAFTLARIEIERLDSPFNAALHFARAEKLNPHGPLAEDALARQAEAWSRAKEPQRARLAARDYVERYPNGVHAADMRKLIAE